MRRRWGAMAASVLLAPSCGAGSLGEPVYGLDQCRHVELIDESSGATITGAEDLAVDAKNNRLIISAYDRRAVEKSSKKLGRVIPHGGVFEVAISALFDEEEAKATPLIDAQNIEGGLRPHGLDFDPASGEIVFINRAYQPIGRHQLMTPQLLRLTENGVEFEREVHCAANDLKLYNDDTLLSFDHRDCGFKATLEDMLAQSKSGLYILGGAMITNQVRFANGVAKSGDEILLAATRENAIRRYRYDGRAFLQVNSYTLPGAPDNLSVKGDGMIVAALHSSLLRLGLNRKLGIGRAPSRIVSVDLENGLVTALFEDKKGALFSAATVGVEVDEGLIAGSVTDSGLLVCKAAA